AHEIGQMSDVTNILRICPENVQHQRSHAGRIDGSTTGPSLSLLSKDSDFPFNTRFADLKPYSILARGHKLGLFAVVLATAHVPLHGLQSRFGRSHHLCHLLSCRIHNNNANRFLSFFAQVVADAPAKRRIRRDISAAWPAHTLKGEPFRRPNVE